MRLKSNDDRTPEAAAPNRHRNKVTIIAHKGLLFFINRINVTMFARPSLKPGAGAGIGTNESTVDNTNATAVKMDMYVIRRAGKRAARLLPIDLFLLKDGIGFA